jgi:inner membrane protein
MSPWAWAIMALLLALGDIALPGAYLVWIAFGAGVTGIVTGLAGLGWESQALLFSGASAFCCWIGMFVYRSFQLGRAEEGPQRGHDMDFRPD